MNGGEKGLCATSRIIKPKLECRKARCCVLAPGYNNKNEIYRARCRTHEKVKQPKQHSHEEGPMATFQKHWITPGAAVFTVHGPKSGPA